MAVDLVLDPAIRTWVFLPIVILVFTVGIMRHYAVLLLRREKKATAEQIQQRHYVARSRLLRVNGNILPPKSFEMRRQFHLDDNGFLANNSQPREMNLLDGPLNPEMFIGQVVNSLPTILIGSWINSTFSGFLTTRMPFPLTRKFAEMLQRGVTLTSLDASWVSSLSWYFLNVFGLQSVYALLLGEENAADSMKAMEEQTKMGAGLPMQDENAVIRAEWEALKIHKYQFKFGKGARKNTSVL
uniref:ER membrane protein complex subunit 3 n=1 Tax=Steinernema glaseri TaxID=37863 RepID=A0A1I7Z7I8_9BILA